MPGRARREEVSPLTEQEAQIFLTLYCALRVDGWTAVLADVNRWWVRYWEGNWPVSAEFKEVAQYILDAREGK